jgi:hypothetical protein
MKSTIKTTEPILKPVFTQGTLVKFTYDDGTRVVLLCTDDKPVVVYSENGPDKIGAVWKGKFNTTRDPDAGNYSPFFGTVTMTEG